MTVTIRNAEPHDIDLIHGFILALAEYEKLAHEVRADREVLARHLFGPRPMAEVLIAEREGDAIGFALFSSTISPRSRGVRASISKTSSSIRRRAAVALAKRCWPPSLA